MCIHQGFTPLAIDLRRYAARIESETTSPFASWARSHLNKRKRSQQSGAISVHSVYSANSLKMAPAGLGLEALSASFKAWESAVKPIPGPHCGVAFVGCHEVLGYMVNIGKLFLSRCLEPTRLPYPAFQSTVSPRRRFRAAICAADREISFQRLLPVDGSTGKLPRYSRRKRQHMVRLTQGWAARPAASRARSAAAVFGGWWRVSRTSSASIT